MAAAPRPVGVRGPRSELTPRGARGLPATATRLGESTRAGFSTRSPPPSCCDPRTGTTTDAHADTHRQMDVTDTHTCTGHPWTHKLTCTWTHALHTHHTHVPLPAGKSANASWDGCLRRWGRYSPLILTGGFCIVLSCLQRSVVSSGSRDTREVGVPPPSQGRHPVR